MSQRPSGTITFLFTDIEGSTKLWENYPEAMKTSLALHDKLLRETIEKYDGYVSFISQEAEFTPKYIQTQTERVKLVYRIKVRVDNSSLDLKPGMPADAYIHVE